MKKLIVIGVGPGAMFSVMEIFIQQLKRLGTESREEIEIKCFTEPEQMKVYIQWLDSSANYNVVWVFGSGFHALQELVSDYGVLYYLLLGEQGPVDRHQVFDCVEAFAGALEHFFPAVRRGR